MFGKSYHLFDLFGFHIKVDATWTFLATLILWTLAEWVFPIYHPNFDPTIYWCMAILSLIGFAVSILLHELGHAVVARYFNMPIHDILLFVFGGVAEMEEEPGDAKEEFLMAAAGPVVSYVLGMSFILVDLTGQDLGVPEPFLVVPNYLGILNIVLAIFNIVPAFPLDGGRMLRAVLWGWKQDVVRATRISAIFGNIFAIILMGTGFYLMVMGEIVSGIWYCVLGMFVHLAAGTALKHTLTRALFSHRKVSEFMMNLPATVKTNLPLDEFVQNYVFKYYASLFPVVDETGELIGSIDVNRVKTIDRAKWQEMTVGDLMIKPTIKTITSAHRSVAKVYAKMHKHGLREMIVEKNKRPIGIVTLRDLWVAVTLSIDFGQEHQHHDFKDLHLDDNLPIKDDSKEAPVNV